MQLVSLFSGIGGFEIAAEWVGWEIVSSCEINPFGQRILKYYWPNAYHHDDVKTLNYEKIRERLRPNKTTVLVAGFPCQPFSSAGKRLGTEDDRYGWPDCIKAVRELSPGFCVFENVRGLTNWNGGMVFDEVQADLEAEGYEIIPFLLPACAVNAPHRRDRIWFVAHASSKSREQGIERGREVIRQEREQIRSDFATIIKGRDVADTENIRHEQSGNTWDGRAGFKNCNCNEHRDAANAKRGGRVQVRNNLQGGFANGNKFNAFNEQTNWLNFPTQPPVCSGDDELPRELDGITFSKWRNESIKGYGNAVVPKLVYEIFKAIESYEQLTTPSPVGRGTKKKK